MEQKQEKIFAKGIYFDRPREGSPEFVKGRINIKVPDLIPFINAHQNNAGYVNLDLKKSKEGKLYLELNTWKPTPKVEENREPTIDPETGRDCSPDNIPF